MFSENLANRAAHDERGWFVAVAASSYVAYAVHGAPARLARITHGPGGTITLHPVGEPFARLDLAVDAGHWRAQREASATAGDAVGVHTPHRRTTATGEDRTPPLPDPDPATEAEVDDWFDAYRTAPEAIWTVAAMAEGDPSLRLGIAAVGGGTVGRSYADNVWIYGLWHANRLHRCGADLRSGSIDRTHHQMAVVLAEVLTADATLDPSIRDRLTNWLADQPTSPDQG